MGEIIVIEQRFNGPPASANGGYACGVVARRIEGPAEVTLRRPPPLATPLELDRAADGLIEVRREDEVIAEARPATLDLAAPPPVPYEKAERAAERYGELVGEHPFPTCFTCGPAREPGDGLRIFSGPINGNGLLASPWVPDGTLMGEGGKVAPEFVWAALDCPSGHAASCGRNETILLGRLTAHVRRLPSAGEPHVLVSWPVGEQGRKRFGGSALYDASGGLLAVAHATWLTVA